MDMLLCRKWPLSCRCCRWREVLCRQRGHDFVLQAASFSPGNYLNSYITQLFQGVISSWKYFVFCCPSLVTEHGPGSDGSGACGSEVAIGGCGTGGEPTADVGNGLDARTP